MPGRQRGRQDPKKRAVSDFLWSRGGPRKVAAAKPDLDQFHRDYRAWMEQRGKPALAREHFQGYLSRCGCRISRPCGFEPQPKAQEEVARPEVVAQTAQQQNRQHIEAFIQAECATGALCRAFPEDFHKAYSCWCLDNSIQSLPMEVFNATLLQMGQQWAWQGLGLRREPQR